jgi:poly-gamma-glutamate synthesis protein (capsule biosynthesis protein)
VESPVKKFIFILIFLLILGIGCLILKSREIEIVPQNPTSENPNLKVEEKPIVIILVGDIILERGVKLKIEKEGNGDFKFPFLKIADELKGADILFGNLEGPISDKGNKVGSIYSFRMDPKAIEGLDFAGFDILSLANNHAFDYGRKALEDTFLRLKAAGIDYIGAGFNEGEAFGPIIKEIQGTKIGFLAYTNLGPETWKATTKDSGIALIDRKSFERIKRDIERTKKEVNILIVSLHAGEEYSTQPTQFQIDFSKMVIDAGADIMIGHHPHVVQKSDQYKTGYIFYSLGNFVFDQSFSKETMEGEIVKVLIENDKIKEIIPKKIKINEFFQPEIENE